MWASFLTRANAEQNKTYYGHVCNTGTYRAIILLLTTKYEIKKDVIHTCYTFFGKND